MEIKTRLSLNAIEGVVDLVRKVPASNAYASESPMPRLKSDYEDRLRGLWKECCVENTPFSAVDALDRAVRMMLRKGNKDISVVSSVTNEKWQYSFI